MIAIPLFQCAIFLAYVTFVVRKYDIPSSLSQSWYLEGKKNYLFSLFIFSLAITTCLLDETAFFISGGLLGFVGAATAFRQDPVTATVHTVGATGGIVMALVGLALHGIWLPAIVATAASVLINDKQFEITNRTFWTQVACFIASEVGIFILRAR